MADAHLAPSRPPSACGHIRPSRPAYPRHTQPIIPLSVRPRKMPARPRGAQCGCACCRYVLSAWQPTFVDFQRLYPGSFIVHFGDIFVAIIPLRHILITSLRHDVFIKKSIFYTFFVILFAYSKIFLYLCTRIKTPRSHIFVPPKGPNQRRKQGLFYAS